MFEWIQDNKDWLFSGAALIIIPAIYRSFKTQFNKLLPAKFKLKLFSAETLILFAIICILSGWLIHSLGGEMGSGEMGSSLLLTLTQINKGQK